MRRYELQNCHNLAKGLGAFFSLREKAGSGGGNLLKDIKALLRNENRKGWFGEEYSRAKMKIQKLDPTLSLCTLMPPDVLGNCRR